MITDEVCENSFSDETVIVTPDGIEVVSKPGEWHLSVKPDQALLISQWYNDKQCWLLKGGIGSLKSFRNHRYYQPKGGIPDAKVGGRKVWSKATVKEWLLITDEMLPLYHEKYKTGAVK